MQLCHDLDIILGVQVRTLREVIWVECSVGSGRWRDESLRRLVG